jgi:hypothetical protein
MSRSSKRYSVGLGYKCQLGVNSEGLISRSLARDISRRTGVGGLCGQLSFAAAAKPLPRVGLVSSPSSVDGPK